MASNINNKDWEVSYFSDELCMYVYLTENDIRNLENFKLTLTKLVPLTISVVGISLFVTSNPSEVLAKTIQISKTAKKITETIVVDEGTNTLKKGISKKIKRQISKMVGKRHKLGPISPIDIVYLMNFRYTPSLNQFITREKLLRALPSTLRNFQTQNVIYNSSNIPTNYNIFVTIIITSFILQTAVPTVLSTLIKITGGSNSNANNINTDMNWTEEQKLLKTQRIKTLLITISLLSLSLITLYTLYRIYKSDQAESLIFNQRFASQKENIMQALSQLERHIFIHKQLGQEKDLKKYLRMIYKMTFMKDDLKIPKVFKGSVD